MKKKQNFHQIRYNIVYTLTRFIAKPYLKTLNYSWDKPKHFPKPTIVLSNHNSDFDPILVSLCFKDQMFFVASENCFRKGTLSKFFVWGYNPVSKIKGASDTLAVMKAIRLLKQGKNICIFPEGGRSFTGITNEVKVATGKLVKISGANLVTFKIQGAYLKIPRWGFTRRKGSWNGKFMNFYSSDQLKNMTPEEITRYFKSQNISGLIICGMSKNDEYLKQLVESKEFKCVLVDAPIVNEVTSSIGVDNALAQYEVAKLTIIENTCKRVLYIAGTKNSYMTEERLSGMQKLKEDLGLTMTVRYGEYSELKAREIAFKYAKNKDVVVCESDLMAIGAMNALTEMDIFRPVCGFDGITLMGYVGKQMNTLRQDFYNISSNAVKELKYLLDGGEGRRTNLPHSIVKLYYKDIIK